ncbi:MAG: transaldolase [Gammaproteobacteria bacterium]|nr:transaldolase [Gammaproteobacteria bacterium]
MSKNPLAVLYSQGQSPWLDNIHREMIHNGELAEMIKSDSLKGITSNPSIFQKAISSGTAYQDSILAMLKTKPDYNARDLFYDLAVEDIQNAADLLKPVYEETNYCDGMVSIEVSPDLAYDTQGTIQEARYLYEKVGRANVMIKVPATKEGLPAVEALIADGISVNVTLLFSVERYKEVANAYLRGLETRLKKGDDISHIASVASFFVSRVDALVDKLLEEQLASANDDQRSLISNLKGSIAIANAKLAYSAYQDLFSSDQFQTLKDKGAQTQRLLWASTGVKNPSYSDVLYIETLIGADTVNTMPPATMAAFKDHGQVANTLTQGAEQAANDVSTLSTLGLDLNAITTQLEKEGVNLFIDAFNDLVKSIQSTMQNIQQRATG